MDKLINDVISRKQLTLFDTPRHIPQSPTVESNAKKATQPRKEIPKMEKTNKGFDVDWEPKQRKRVFLQPDSYGAVIIGVGDIFLQKNPFNNNEEEPKLAVQLEIPSVQQEGKAVQFAYFMKAKIAHSAKKDGYSDSKLYSLLEKAELLDECKTFWATVKDQPLRDAELTRWLREKLLGREVKVLIKTVLPKDGSEKYSMVGELLRFLDVIQEEKVQ